MTAHRTLSVPLTFCFLVSYYFFFAHTKFVIYDFFLLSSSSCLLYFCSVLVANYPTNVCNGC